MEMKTCSNCKTPKPATREYFYKGYTNLDGLESWCIDCKKASKSIGYKDLKPRDKGEALAIDRLLAQGIPTIPGKNRRDKKWVDAVAWGCVDIEVKYSNKLKEWQWTFRSTINQATSIPDVIMLIGGDRHTGKTHYYLFDAMHPFFFNADGSRIISIHYDYPAKMRMKTLPMFGLDDLLMHENNFDIVEKVRLRKQAELLEMAKQLAEAA